MRSLRLLPRTLGLVGGEAFASVALAGRQEDSAAGRVGGAISVEKGRANGERGELRWVRERNHGDCGGILEIRGRGKVRTTKQLLGFNKTSVTTYNCPNLGLSYFFQNIKICRFLSCI